jgi:hypothetical protein
VDGAATRTVPVRNGVTRGAAILRAGRSLLPKLLPLLLTILPLLLLRLLLRLTLRLILRATLPLVWSLTRMRSAVRMRCGAGRGIGRFRRRSASSAHMLRESRRNSETCAQQQRKYTTRELEFSAHATLHLLIRRTRIILLLL